MRSKLSSLSLFFAFSFVLAFVSAVHGAAAAQPQPRGQIKAVRVRGDVFATVKATQVRTAVADNAMITDGTTVTTAKGASVVLVFSNGATINLGTDSALDIDQFTQDAFTTSFNAATITEEPTTSTTRLNLAHGELVSKVAKLHQAGGSSFIVATPVGAAGIRGTTFRIVFIPDGAGHATFTLTTLEGNVAVTLATGTVNAPAVSVTNGQEVSVAATVTTDAAGNVTATLPSGASTVVATTASAATTQQVTDSAAAIAQAVANVVIAPSPPSSGSVTPNNTNSNTNETPTPAIQPINPTVVSPSA
jgi:hypothetical protein